KKCSSLKKVTFKTNKLTTIEASLFEGCKKLTAITLPDSISKIKKQAFKGSGLTAITIPGQVTAIEEEAFANCKGLKEITFTGSQLTGIGSNAFHNVPADCVFRVPAGQTENIKALLMASGLGDTVTVTEY
ncbi:MAG: leucine-rich repeat domain-containing protein, partial [Lachnospira sp.]|nr:leucine-rich repeat domain-containing protein [Lachnospira sp.]